MLPSHFVRAMLHRAVDRLARRFAYEVRVDARRNPPINVRERYAAIATLSARYGYASLSGAELSVFSQNGEDGVIAEIFSRIGSTNTFFVEFGVEDGLECNTRFLAEVLGWSGVYLEPDPTNFRKLAARLSARDDLVTVETAVSPSNVNRLFEISGVPDEPDLVSIDVDGQDYWIWQSMGARPRVLVIEYNSALDPDERLVEPLGTHWTTERSEHFGASLGALVALGRDKGYQLVHAELAGVNLFFVRDDLAEHFGPALRRGMNFGLAGVRHPPAAGPYVQV